MQNFMEAMRISKEVRFSWGFWLLGSLSYALEDITGGYTEKIDLNNWMDNPNFYWNRLKDYIDSVILHLID